jgi:hypothetical protein
MTTNDYCYYGACVTRMVATSAYSSDKLSYMSGPLLLPPTVATGSMTSDDHFYYGAHGTRAVSISPNIRASHLTLADHCYYHLH